MKIPDFAVHSQEAGFDKFLKVYNEYFKFDFFGNAKFYGAKNGENYQTGQAWITPITPSQAIALLTNQTTDKMNTLANTCFQYDGSDDSKNIIRIMNKNHRSDFKGNDKYFYWIANDIAETFYKMDKDLTEIPPYEYLALLTGKQLTEEEKPTIENACFYHDGSDEAKELYRACCKMLGFEKESDGYEGSFTIVNNTQKCIEGLTIVKHGYVQVSISDYFKLLPTQESNSKVSWNRSIKDSESLNTTQESVKQDNAKEFLKNKKITRATCYTDNGNTFYLNDITVLMDEYSTQQTAHLQQQLNTLTSEIKRLQEKYDENGYDCSNEIKLLRIENHIDFTLSFYHKEVTDLQQQLKEAKELITQIDFHLNYYGQIDKDTQIQINQFLTRNQ